MKLLARDPDASKAEYFYWNIQHVLCTWPIKALRFQFEAKYKPNLKPNIVTNPDQKKKKKMDPDPSLEAPSFLLPGLCNLFNKCPFFLLITSTSQTLASSCRSFTMGSWTHLYIIFAVKDNIYYLSSIYCFITKTFRCLNIVIIVSAVVII
jgi:hypothetical protein